MTIHLMMPNIPGEAMSLICGDVNRYAACERFLARGRAQTMELRTFGLFITPISREFSDGRKKIIGHVVFWENGKTTISIVEGDESALVGDVDLDTPPSSDECLELFKNRWILED